MKYEISKSEQLEEGKHTGVIGATSVREVVSKKDNKEYSYFDIPITPDGADYEKVCSVPAPKEGLIKEGSRLGKILAKFQELEVGAKEDPSEILDGKKVTFLAKEDGEYTKIDWETIKPAKG